MKKIEKKPIFGWRSFASAGAAGEAFEWTETRHDTTRYGTTQYNKVEYSKYNKSNTVLLVPKVNLYRLNKRHHTIHLERNENEILIDQDFFTMSNIRGLYDDKKDDPPKDDDGSNNRYVGGIGAQGGGR